MVTKIEKWGNELAIRIPAAVSQKIGVVDGSVVHIVVEGGRLIVSARPFPHYRLEDLLAGIRPENLHAETDTGTASGKEAW